jgi:hypothetical protein
MRERARVAEARQPGARRHRVRQQGSGVTPVPGALLLSCRCGCVLAPPAQEQASNGQEASDEGDCQEEAEGCEVEDDRQEVARIRM